MSADAKRLSQSYNSNESANNDDEELNDNKLPRPIIRLETEDSKAKVSKNKSFCKKSNHLQCHT